MEVPLKFVAPLSAPPNELLALLDFEKSASGALSERVSRSKGFELFLPPDHSLHNLRIRLLPSPKGIGESFCDRHLICLAVQADPSIDCEARKRRCSATPTTPPPGGANINTNVP